MARKLTYTDAMEELEGIVAEIESETVDVDRLAEKVKRASYLIGFCKGKLRDTELEVRKVLSEMEAPRSDDSGETDVPEADEDGPEEDSDDPGEDSDEEGGLF